MIKLVICVALLAHGIGHVLFLVPTLRLATWADQTGHSWLAEPLLGDGLSRLVCSAAWISALVLFVAAAIGLYLGTPWWLAAAALGSVISLVALISSWGGIYASSAVFAVAFDVVVLVALVWVRSTGPQLAGN